MDEIKREQLIARIRNDVARIGVAEYVFHEDQERMSLHKDEVSTTWPHPIGLEELETFLAHVPSGLDRETLDKLTSMYSLGWHGGRQNLLENEIVRDAYYKTQGIGQSHEVTQEVSAPPTLDELETLDDTMNVSHVSNDRPGSITP